MTGAGRGRRLTLRRRLLLLQVAVFGGLLLASPATYLLISRSLNRDLDEHLTFLARTLARQHLVPDESDPGRGGPPPCLGFAPESAGTGGRATHSPRHLLVEDARGAVRCSDGERRALAPAMVARARATMAPAFATLELPAETLRLIAWPVRDPRGGTLVMEVGASHILIDRTLREGIAFLLAVDIAALLLLLAGSYSLARRAFAPVDRMVRRVEQIDEANLAERLPSVHADDELGRLAVVINRMLARLQRAFEGQRRFSSDVSHEIRSPLTALRGQIEVALRRERSSDEYRLVLEECLEEVVRLSRLAENLMSLAQADAGVLEFRRVAVDLGELAARAVQRFEARAGDRGVRLELYVSDELAVPGDPDWLGRLLENLLDNAILHTGRGGEVQVRLHRAERRALVTITDSGEGIAEEHLPHIFERFYRVDRARSRDKGGAGLGLAIALEIARLHGGTIEARSALGTGSTFVVKLPVVARAADRGGA